MSEEMKACPVCESPYGYSTGDDSYTCPECANQWSPKEVKLENGSFEGGKAQKLIALKTPTQNEVDFVHLYRRLPSSIYVRTHPVFKVLLDLLVVDYLLNRSVTVDHSCQTLRS